MQNSRNIWKRTVAQLQVLLEQLQVELSAELLVLFPALITAGIVFKFFVRQKNETNYCNL